MKKRNTYTTLQIKKELHTELVEYCDRHGYKISGLIENLVKERIHNDPTSKKVLKVKRE